MQEKNSINVIERNGQLVVDSRLVAQELGIKHKTFIQTIRKYKTEIEQGFGQLPFEKAVVSGHNGGGNSETFCYLNEHQASFVMTLSRNTSQVVECKLKLVESFRQAQNLLKEKQQSSINPISDIQVLRGMLDTIEKNAVLAQQNSKSIATLESKISNLEIEKQELEHKLEEKAKEDKEVIESVAMLSEANSNELERFKNGHGYWYSVIGYAAKHGLGSFSAKTAAVIGRKATALCKRMGISPERVPDPRFGYVNTYPENILAEVM
ncbi:MAG: hypothetical protein F6K23_37835 [Okeania sp. SIO2C9]|uniref:Rha family transcriptional regulator n=1 Tax=Okeania sp. SIO2C9 TaxID=2607791 RepID=UPI0013BEF1C0|nr:Rha family transcriptional regulator [Okeania sp. SIO2C9]NEQ78250.1 hypothetical protein [Okeania sp. SIO2C9]